MASRKWQRNYKGKNNLLASKPVTSGGLKNNQIFQFSQMGTNTKVLEGLQHNITSKMFP